MLKINDLIVAFKTENGELTAVKGVSLDVAAGETLALVGESGCGKTVLCKSMLKILCERGNIKQGEILLEERNLVPLTEEEMIHHRGSGIAMVFQDPMTSLDPTMPVGEQIAVIITQQGHFQSVMLHRNPTFRGFKLDSLFIIRTGRGNVK